MSVADRPEEHRGSGQAPYFSRQFWGGHQLGALSAERWAVRESAGINRHREGDENALHRRPSESRWPRVMRWRSVRAQRSVGRGRAGGVIEPRNPKKNQGADAFLMGGRQYGRRRFPRAAGGPCAVGELRHARRAPCARTGRSGGRPLVVDDAPSGMVRGVADQHRVGREANASGGNPSMNDREKSDRLVLPAIPPNNPAQAGAEVGEGRACPRGGR